jgi:hypothetical protein
MTPLSALSMSEKYLRTARELSGMIVRSKNRSISLTRKPLSPAESDRRTRRSDTNIGAPLLFNFYHALELTIKGHALGQGQSKITGHKLSALLSKLQSNPDIDPLIAELRKWIPPPATSPIGKFLTVNTITIDDWYQALKYSSLTTGTPINHFNLKYGGANTLAFWQSLNKSCTALLMYSVSAARAGNYA